MSGNEEGQAEQETRSECPIIRTHRRFLLRQLEFTQQYAPMYRSRMAAQQDRAIAAIKRVVSAEDGDGAAPSDVLRVLEMRPGIPAFSVGVVYKQMKLLPRFLDEYQRELVRIDAGDDDEGEGAEGDGAESVAAADAGDEGAAGSAREPGSADGALDDGQDRAAADERYSVCHTQDELMLEDSSGRVTLQGLKAANFCTGVVIGIYGTLMTNGQVLVHRYAFANVGELYVPRPLPAVSAQASGGRKHTPCYIAFVCGLDVTLPENIVSEAVGAMAGGAPKSPTIVDTAGNHAALVRHRALLELLVEFISGTTSDGPLLEKSKYISRLVIGGNSIAPTDELKLKRKVKLDPSDHVRLNDDKATASVVTSAKLMRELDVLLERLVTTVEVELMPGDNDMSDAFQPQQPLHPVLLPNAGRYSTLRLVSNPFEFTAVVGEDMAGAKQEDEEQKPGNKTTGPRGKSSSAMGEGVGFFVTSGQNVNDVARETKFDTHLDAMSMILASGCACPTAPNTLFSYPFRDVDPFLFLRTPHCFVACDQPRFETRYVDLQTLQKEASVYLEPDSQRDGEAKGVEEEGDGRTTSAPSRNVKEEGKASVPAARIICVPSFARSGSLVLVDVNSPTLETSCVTFAIRGLDGK